MRNAVEQRLQLGNIRAQRHAHKPFASGAKRRAGYDGRAMARQQLLGKGGACVARFADVKKRVQPALLFWLGQKRDVRHPPGHIFGAGAVGFVYIGKYLAAQGQRVQPRPLGTMGATYTLLSFISRIFCTSGAGAAT